MGFPLPTTPCPPRPIKRPSPSPLLPSQPPWDKGNAREIINRFLVGGALGVLALLILACHVTRSLRLRGLARMRGRQLEDGQELSSSEAAFTGEGAAARKQGTVVRVAVPELAEHI